MERREFLSKASMAFAATLTPIEAGAREGGPDIKNLADLTEGVINEILPEGVVGFEFRLTVAGREELVELSATGALGPMFYDLEAGMWK